MAGPNTSGQVNLPAEGAPQGWNGPSWLPQPGDRGMPPAQGQPPGQGQPTLPVGPPVPPQQVIQEQWRGYSRDNLPPAPQQPGQPQPQTQTQPQAAPQSYQQPASAQAQPQPGIGLDTVLQGSQFPAELQGRTMREALQTYQGMRNVIMQNLYGQPLPSGQPQAQPAPAPAKPAQPPAQGEPQWDWKNPGPAIKAMVQEAVQSNVAPMIAPIHQQTMMRTIQEVRQSVANELGPQRFAQLEPQILGMLNGVDPNYLTNPQTWRVAAWTAIGQQAAYGRPAEGQPQPQANGAPVQNLPPGMNPVPNLNSFFTERPGTSARQEAGPQPLNPMEQYVARQMGKSEAEYAAWKGGIAR